MFVLSRESYRLVFVHHYRSGSTSSCYVTFLYLRSILCKPTYTHTWYHFILLHRTVISCRKRTCPVFYHYLGATEEKNIYYSEIRVDHRIRIIFPLLILRLDFLSRLRTQRSWELDRRLRELTRPMHIWKTYIYKTIWLNKN